VRNDPSNKLMCERNGDHSQIGNAFIFIILVRVDLCGHISYLIFISDSVALVRKAKEQQLASTFSECTLFKANI